MGPLEDTNKTIKGFAGARTNNPKIGTLRWQWSDDSGKMHSFEIPNSYYVPACELRFLSPKHWAQTRNPVHRATTRFITSSVNVYLRWTKGDENYELTLPLNKKGYNVGTLYSHPGYNKYDLLCQASEITITDDNDPIALLATIISGDEDNEDSNTEPQIGPPPIIITRKSTGIKELHQNKHQKTTRVNSTSAKPYGVCIPPENMFSRRNHRSKESFRTICREPWGESPSISR